MNINVDAVLYVLGGLTAVWVFYDRIVKAINDIFDKKLQPMQEDIQSLTNDMDMLKDVNYQMLSHMATDNNSGGMKEALDKYVKYSMKK